MLLEKLPEIVAEDQAGEGSTASFSQVEPSAAAA